MAFVFVIRDMIMVRVGHPLTRLELAAPSLVTTSHAPLTHLAVKTNAFVIVVTKMHRVEVLKSHKTDLVPKINAL